eukprot:1139613-Pelagomonas_calceolata.AAC.2
MELRLHALAKFKAFMQAPTAPKARPRQLLGATSWQAVWIRGLRQSYKSSQKDIDQSVFVDSESKRNKAQAAAGCHHCKKWCSKFAGCH